MPYVDVVFSVPNALRHEMTGSVAIQLAEKAHREGRFDEARGLVELAYRLFDDAADVVPLSMHDCGDELHVV